MQEEKPYGRRDVRGLKTAEPTPRRWDVCGMQEETAPFRRRDA